MDVRERRSRIIYRFWHLMHLKTWIQMVHHAKCASLFCMHRGTADVSLNFIKSKPFYLKFYYFYNDFVWSVNTRFSVSLINPKKYARQRVAWHCFIDFKFYTTKRKWNVQIQVIFEEFFQPIISLEFHYNIIYLPYIRSVRHATSNLSMNLNIYRKYTSCTVTPTEYNK